MHRKGLLPYRTSDQKQAACFIGHLFKSTWSKDIIDVCDRVLPDFGLKPWYAERHFEPTKPLREKIIELIAHSKYGIYDLSYWREKDSQDWQMSPNVLIELGIAIGLNRPILLIRHKKSAELALPLPACLESITQDIDTFGGQTTLEKVIRQKVPQMVEYSSSPQQDWYSSHCTFGNRNCEFRTLYPTIHSWEKDSLSCHISDGNDIKSEDFRAVVEGILENYTYVNFYYLDALALKPEYQFLLCSHCQTVRTSPLAVYRITPHTPPEAFISIGISLALEVQFESKIPKVLLTENRDYIPSLLQGYEVVIAHNDGECQSYLREFIPQVLDKIQEVKWHHATPLPYHGPRIVQKNIRKEQPFEDELAEVLSGEAQKPVEDLAGLVEILPGETQKPVEDLAKASVADKQPVTKICPRCGNGNRIQALFCSRCGLPLTDPPSPTSIDIKPETDDSSDKPVLEAKPYEESKNVLPQEGISEPILPQMAKPFDHAHDTFSYIHKSLILIPPS